MGDDKSMKTDLQQTEMFEVVDNRGPVNIIKDNGDHSFSLCENDLAAILMGPAVRDTKVVVVSVAGAFRKGKSFLLDFFLRYLVNEGRDGWEGEPSDKLTGFNWRGGSARDTSGIWMWGTPFVRTNSKTGEKVAIILMDTQGAFDNQSIVKDSATVFALSTMLSSIQVYNISQMIREDDLQHLHLFTDYGRLAMEDDNSSADEKPFQRLEFLIRDWAIAYEHENGAVGGGEYLNKILAISETQHDELQAVRHHISKCFEKVGCFLLPHPGKKVAGSPNFKGELQDMDEDFVDSLKEFVPYILSEDNLTAKKIHGVALKGKDLLHYFKAYMSIYQQDNMPEPKTMLRATAEANNLAALASAQELYTAEMDKLAGSSSGYVNETDLLTHHATCCDIAEKDFKAVRKMGGDDFSLSYLNKLTDFMEKELEEYLKQNESKNIFNSARTPITLFIILSVAYVIHGIFAVLYIGPLAFMSNLVFWGAMLTLGVWVVLKWKGEYPEYADKIDDVAQQIWEQGMTPLYAVLITTGTTIVLAQAAKKQSVKSKKRS